MFISIYPRQVVVSKYLSRFLSYTALSGGGQNSQVRPLIATIWLLANIDNALIMQVRSGPLRSSVGCFLSLNPPSRQAWVTIFLYISADQKYFRKVGRPWQASFTYGFYGFSRWFKITTLTQPTFAFHSPDREIYRHSATILHANILQKNMQKIRIFYLKIH